MSTKKGNNQADGDQTPADGPPFLTRVLDQFDPENLRLTQDFLKTGGVQKHFTSVPVRKPTKEEWIRVRHEQEYMLDTLLLKLKDANETYLVAPALQAEMAAEATVAAHRLFTAINRQGALFLWPAKLPSPDGRHDRWSESALEAAEAAKDNWVRVQAELGLGSYVFYTPRASFPGPQWPELDLKEILRLAFKVNVIDSQDHVVLRRLRGEL